MRNEELSKLVAQYENSSSVIYNEMFYGTHNNRIINKEQDKQTKILKQIYNDRKFLGEFIEKIWNSDNPYSRVQAASYCLAFNFKKDDAIERLKSLIKNKVPGSLFTDAIITLDLWEKNGKIVLWRLERELKNDKK